MSFALSSSPPERFTKNPAGTRAGEDAWNEYAAADLALRETRRRFARSGVGRRAESRYIAEGLSERAAWREAARDESAYNGAARAADLAPTAELRRLAGILADELAELAPGARAKRAEITSQLFAITSELESRSNEQSRSPGERLISTIRKSARRCEKRSVLVSCECGAHIVDGGCSRTDCVRCAPARTSARARVIYDKLDAGLSAARLASRVSKDARLFPLRITVLTMPPEVRERFTTAAAFTELRRRVSHLFRDELGAAWSCIIAHPVGDEDPAEFHPHLNVLWCARKPGRGVLAPEVIERIRERWAELVGAAYVAGTAPVVHLGFLAPGCKDFAAKLRHRARYYGRVFVGWGRWMRKGVQWYGDYVRGLAPRCTCGECKGSFAIVSVGPEAVELYERWAAIAASAPTGPPDRPSPG